MIERVAKRQIIAISAINIYTAMRDHQNTDTDLPHKTLRFYFHHGVKEI